MICFCCLKINKKSEWALCKYSGRIKNGKEMCDTLSQTGLRSDGDIHRKQKILACLLPFSVTWVNAAVLCTFTLCDQSDGYGASSYV